MVSCSASGCSNRGEKGFSMKSFPRDPTIRKQWKKNVDRVDWEPTENSKLCEVHFRPEMWEKPRVDGKKKLKWNAIPTIFPTSTSKVTKTKTTNLQPVLVESNSSYSQTDSTDIPSQSDAIITTATSDLSTTANNTQTIHLNSFVTQSNDVSTKPSKMIVNVESPSVFHNYAQPPDKEPETNNQEVQVNYDSLVNLDNTPGSSSVFSESFVSDINNPANLNNTDLFKKIYQYQRSYTQLLAKVNNFKDQIKDLKQQNLRLVKIAKKDRHLRLLKHVFNDDQICALERNNSRFMKWSQTTLISALRLKNYCGKDGYEEILRQKIPLPSIRTLNRVKITDAVNSMIGTNHISNNR